MATINRASSDCRRSHWRSQWHTRARPKPQGSSLTPLASHLSPQPRAPSLQPPASRCGLTLVELLVVIAILGMVTVATIPLMAPAVGGRKVRESARLVSGFFANAQARALATGRPCGVWITRLSTTVADAQSNQAIDLFLCESPPPYTGETMTDTCTISSPPGPNPTSITITFSTAIPAGIVHLGDLIRFNYRGTLYRILTGTVGADGSVTGTSVTATVAEPGQPLPNLANASATLAYQIFRQPVKSADAPIILPTGALVDLSASGYSSNNAEFAADPTRQKPVMIIFGPSGNVDSVYYGDGNALEGRVPTSALYFLIGKPTAEDPTADNYKDFENVWVSINAQSGLITTSEVSPAAGGGPPTNVGESRAYARTAQNMGGR